MHNNLAIIISEPNKKYIETQLLQCITISNNILLTYAENNDIQDFLLSIINKYKYTKVFLLPFKKTDEIEYNPVSNNTIFWNNISRISAIMALYTKDIDINNIDSLLFLNNNEIPNMSISNYLNKNDNYIFNNDILLIKYNIFKSDIDIYKIFMRERERKEIGEFINCTKIEDNDLFVII